MIIRNYGRSLSEALEARASFSAPRLLEGHAVTALSSVFMAMTSMLAWACHLSQPRATRHWSRLFWPVFSFAFLFFEPAAVCSSSPMAFLSGPDGALRRAARGR